MRICRIVQKRLGGWSVWRCQGNFTLFDNSSGDNNIVHMLFAKIDFVYRWTIFLLLFVFAFNSTAMTQGIVLLTEMIWSLFFSLFFVCLLGYGWAYKRTYEILLLLVRKSADQHIKPYRFSTPTERHSHHYTPWNEYWFSFYFFSSFYPRFSSFIFHSSNHLVSFLFVFVTIFFFIFSSSSFRFFVLFAKEESHCAPYLVEYNRSERWTSYDDKGNKINKITKWTSKAKTSSRNWRNKMRNWRW